MPLNLLFDARPLVDQRSGGVRRVARMLLEELLATQPDMQITCVTTGIRKPVLPDPFATHPHVTHLHITIPNKLWSLLAMFGIVSLDGVAARMQKEFGIWNLEFGFRSRPNSKFQIPNSSSNDATTQRRQTQRVFDAVILPNLGFVGFMETPYALVMHDCSFLIEPRWFPLKMQYWHLAVNPKEIARRAQRIFCVSETTARDTERLLKVPREQIRVFQPGVPVMSHELRVMNVNVDTPAPFVLTFSENDPRKNTVTAIAAVEELRKEERFKNLRLIIIGSKKENGTWNMEHDRSIDILPTPHAPRPTHPPITRLPSVTDAELAELYRTASAVCYPSWYEGFGLPLHEAARYGTPCLASVMGSLPETAPAGTVFLPPSKPHLWTAMLREVLEMPDRYRTTCDASALKTDLAPITEWLNKIEKHV